MVEQAENNKAEQFLQQAALIRTETDKQVCDASSWGPAGVRWMSLLTLQAADMAERKKRGFVPIFGDWRAVCARGEHRPTHTHVTGDIVAVVAVRRRRGCGGWCLYVCDGAHDRGRLQAAMTNNKAVMVLRFAEAEAEKTKALAKVFETPRPVYPVPGPPLDRAGP